MNLLASSFDVSESQAKAISLLAHLLKNNGDKILSGVTKLSLTTSVLHIINEGFSHIVDEHLDKTFHTQVASSVENGVLEDLVCLYDFIQKTVCLKITHGITTLQNNVNLNNLRSLQVLEVKKVPSHMLVGLKDLRQSLTTLVCSRCVNKLEDIFEVCGGDRAEALPWPLLKILILNYNNLEELDSSLRLLPSLEILDLSHNSISNTTYIQCLNKITWLNLSYNHLQALPIFNVNTLAHLKVLNLRNNNLEDLKDLQYLVCLEELDLGFNCLIHHAQLESLSFLNSLKILSLDGNPLFFHNNHRILTVQYLNQEVLTANLQLDGKCLKQKEILHGKKFESPLAFRSSASSSLVNSGNFTTSYSSGSNLLREDSCESSQNENNIENSNTSVNSARKKKKPLIREVKLEDEANEADETAVPKAQRDANSEHLKTKTIVENFRKERGNNWLVASSRSEDDFPLPRTINKFSNPSSYSSLSDEKYNSSNCSANEKCENDCIQPVEPKVTEISADIHDKSTNEVQIDSNCVNCDEIGKEQDLFANNSDYTDDYTDDDIDDDHTGEELFIVDRHCCNEITNVFVSIWKNKLREKDVLTARTIQCFDINSLISIEKVSHLSHGTRLNFDSVRKDRKERIYTLESEEYVELLLSLLQPSVDARVLKDATSGAFQCLSCNAHFSRDMAKLKLQTSKGAVKCANGKMKDLLTEVSACPFCDSVMLIELEDEILEHDSKDLDKNSVEKDEIKGSPTGSLLQRTIDKFGKLSHSYPSTPESSRKTFLPSTSHEEQKSERNYHSLKNSPLSQSPRSFQFDLYACDNVREESVAKISEGSPVEHSPLFHSSQVTFQSLDVSGFPFAQESRLKLAAPIRKQSAGFKNSDGPDGKYNSERRFSTPIVTPAMHRSESDVTILSNPSQSSISVLSTPSGDQVDLIDEQNKFDSPFSFESRLESRQSKSSITGSYSSSTTVERSIYDGTTTPSIDGQREFLNNSRLPMTASNDSILESEETQKSTDSFIFDSMTDLTNDSEIQNPDSIDAVQSGAIKYSYGDFSQIDHKLQLYLDLNLFESQEEFKLILKAKITTLKLTDVPILLIISSKNLYIMKITGEETVEPLKWLQKIDVKNISQLKIIRHHIAYQGFFLEFEKQVTYFILLRDAGRSKRFIKQLSGLYSLQNSTVEVIEPQDNLLNNLTLLLNDKCKKFDCGDEVYILLYSLGYFKSSDKGKQTIEPVSFVVTKNCIFVLNENFQFHMNQSKNENVIQVLQHENVFSVTGMVLNQNNKCEAKMLFLNEDTDENFEWTILMETDRSLCSFIDAVQDTWKKLYDVDLPIDNY